MGQPKVALIGLDSITPVMVERFLAEGRMPNLARLRERGFSSEITSTMPPTTPAAWTTIATGAWPSTHGVEGFSVHHAGEPLHQKHYTLTSDTVRAEFLWQAAERAGKRSILLKYPLSWPPVGGDLVLQVDGAGGWGGLKCVWDLAHSGCWDTHAAPRAAAGAELSANPQEWLTRDVDNLDEEAVNPLPVSEPATWRGLPAGARPLWETALTLRAKGGGAGVTLHLLALAQGGEDRLAIAPDRDLTGVALLAQGQWSDWLRVTLPAAAGPRAGHVRFKVLTFDGPGRRLRLYQSQIHQEAGFTRPERLAGSLLAAAGPFAEWTEGYDLLQGWIDDETQLEIYEQHVDWMCRAARHLLATEPWDLFLSQVHFVDMAYHLYWGTIDPDHPQYDPQKAPYYWDLLGRVHALADRFVGAVADAVDGDTLVAVLGDHGHDSYHTSFLVNHLLIQKGLLALYRDRRTGEPRIDWRETRAYAAGYRVYLNVRGREPQGSLPPERYRATQEEVIQLLHAVCDPRTGRAPVRLACRLEDAESLGLYGSSMGDVILAMAPGFQVRSSIATPADAWAGQRLQADRLPVLRQTELFREFTGEHDSALPFNRAIRTMLVLAGPTIRAGRRPVPVRMVDIAPTLCHYLNIPFPAQCEGGVLADAWQVG
jgi:predicted AlkP superfamily phosphohydrolase/phosphomutase